MIAGKTTAERAAMLRSPKHMRLHIVRTEVLLNEARGEARAARDTICDLRDLLAQRDRAIVDYELKLAAKDRLLDDEIPF
jgi:hypothetical protein